MLERLQKILSARGIASRRKAEEYIAQGLVLVNGEIATLGQKADPDIDRIEVKGEVMQARQEMLYFVMNKPKGVITSNIERTGKSVGAGDMQKTHKKSVQKTNQPIHQSPSQPPTIRDLLPANLRGKIYPVGRLDKESSGLLLFTNDGVLAYRLTHPKFDHEKEYEVETEQDITNGQLRKMEEGMMILGEKTKQARIRRTGPRNFRIALTEGKNRQIRRMCQKVGSPVKELRRVRIMTLEDMALKPGEIRPLTQAEKTQLLASVAL